MVYGTGNKSNCLPSQILLLNRTHQDVRLPTQMWPIRSSFLGLLPQNYAHPPPPILMDANRRSLNFRQKILRQDFRSRMEPQPQGNQPNEWRLAAQQSARLPMFSARSPQAARAWSLPANPPRRGPVPQQVPATRDGADRVVHRASTDSLEPSSRSIVRVRPYRDGLRVFRQPITLHVERKEEAVELNMVSCMKLRALVVPPEEKTIV